MQQLPGTAFRYYELSEAVVPLAKIAEEQMAMLDARKYIVKVPAGKAALSEYSDVIQGWAANAGKRRDALVKNASKLLVIPPAAGGMPDLQRSMATQSLRVAASEENGADDGGWHMKATRSRDGDAPSPTDASPDFVLDHLSAMPDPSTLRAPEVDYDALALQAKLRELATRPMTDLSQATIVPAIPAYGVGATISSLVYPVLEALARDATLFAPGMRNWTSPECQSRDLTCYFEALPSLPQLTSQLLAERRRLRASAAGVQMLAEGASRHHADPVHARSLARLHAPFHDDTTESLCKAVKGLGLGCPQLIHAPRSDTAEASSSPAAAGAPKAESSRSRQHSARHGTILMGTREGERIERTAAPPASGTESSEAEEKLDAAFRALRTPLSLAGLRARHAKPLGLERGEFNMTNGFAVFDEAGLVGRLDRRWLRRGRFWLMSQVIRFLTTPNVKLRARLDMERASLVPTKRPILGLHVRKGDACGDRGECRDLKDYMPTVRSMIERYGYKTVFLATPDPTVIGDTAKFPEVEFRFLPVTNTTALMKAQGFRKIDDAIAAGVVDAGNEFEEAMVSSYLLAEADGFVGGFSSNAARVAYSLMSSGSTGCLKPYDSFDINWCGAFGKGGPQVVRRQDESCSAAKGTKGMEWLPCEISC